jgi:hypothetical protein
MFSFVLEPELGLLTATRSGLWSLRTVACYEVALREQLARLGRRGQSTSFIIDIRSSGALPLNIASALRAVVERLGPLQTDRTAIVTHSGLEKLQAMRVADTDAQVFASMKPARAWILGSNAPAVLHGTVHDVAYEADAEGRSVRLHGASVDVALTPAAALETAKRMGSAAVDALLTPPPPPAELKPVPV